MNALEQYAVDAVRRGLERANARRRYKLHIREKNGMWRIVAPCAGGRYVVHYHIRLEETLTLKILPTPYNGDYDPVQQVSIWRGALVSVSRRPERLPKDSRRHPCPDKRRG